jgi:hypothetical protein
MSMYKNLLKKYLDYVPLNGGEMRNLVRLLRWPEDRSTGLVPWFVIAWRALFMPLVYGGLAVAWLGVALARGPRQAMRFWSNAT